MEQTTGKNGFQRLLEARKSFGRVLKASTNPFHKNKYANLEECLEAVTKSLLDNGLILTFSSESESPGVVSVSASIVDLEGGGSHLLTSSVVLPLKEASPQGGAALNTYGRRYSLLSLFGLAAEDDDGNTASGLADGATVSFSKKEEGDSPAQQAIKTLQAKTGFSPKFK